MTDDPELRKATVDDIVRCVKAANKPLSESAILSGYAMGAGQIDIPAALAAAEADCYIRVHHIEMVNAFIPHRYLVAHDYQEGK